MNVTINGEEYVPFKETSPRIGIAVSTHSRHVVLASTLEEHRKYLPDNVFFVVVDDGSVPAVTVPDWVTLVRHDVSLGIVEAKNTSLHTLIEAGCEELFLWDDDAYPLVKGWEVPYLTSPEPHLAYQFLDLKGKNRLNDMAIIYKDEQHVAYTGQRGVMLYFNKSAIDVVGGFDRCYQRGMYEHPDLALRINNAGLTTWPFADVVNSERLIFSLDEHERVERSVPLANRQAQTQRNVGIYNYRRDNYYAGYAEYRPIKRVVITVLLTSCPDPQRQNQKMLPDPTQLSKWAASIKGAKKIVLADQLKGLPEYPDVEVIAVPEKSDVSPYFLRWLRIYEYLRANPDLTQVWITDGTDVEMLKSPWESMESNFIYVGDEHSTYANPWFAMVNAHPELLNFIRDHSADQVINAGLLGGDYKRVLAVVSGILRIYSMIKSRQFWRDKKVTEIPTDMVVFAMAVANFGGAVKHGPLVNTVFKSKGVGKELAFWQHK